jgi:hypothetical protein
MTDWSTRWPAEQPPDGFADRVLAATRAEPVRAPGRARRAWLPGAALLGAAALLAVFVRPSTPVMMGERITATRETISLGARAIAVAEPDSALGWRVDGAGAHVEQRAGNVFYRVERGGRFVVRTPAGDVEVRGTCFRVEVEPMTKSLVQFAAGAAAATAVLVTVYEGKVLLANEQGQTALAAGEQARAVRGEAPSPANAADAARNQALAAAPTDGASREELLRRDQQQRSELARLRARVSELEQPSGGAASTDSKDHEKYLDPSKEDLKKLADECKLKWDAPSIDTNPTTVSDRTVNELGLSDAERTAVNQVTADENTRVTQQLRQLYLEVTGDKTGADSLGPRALESEIVAKSPDGEMQQIYARLSRERAGLQAAPANPSGESPAERMTRLLTGLGDQYERDLANAIGADRAHQMRTLRDGWGSKHSGSYGCP